MLKKLLAILPFVFIVCAHAFSQTDTTSNRRFFRDSTYRRSYRPVIDSALLAQQNAYMDSVKKTFWVPSETKRPNMFVDSLMGVYLSTDINLVKWGAKHKDMKRKANPYMSGRSLAKGEPWIIACILSMLLFLAILRYYFGKELSIIMQSFFSKRILTQISKEDNLFSSWPFLFLYLLFGCTIGLLLYLSAMHYGIGYALGGFELFIGMAIGVIGLFTLKVMALRLVGFIFEVQKTVNEYVSILYLSYFNSAIVFLPLVIAFSLTPARLGHYYIVLSFVLLSLIFFFQFFRAAINVLSNYRFSKVYLILYLCALEICPIIILIKALKF